MINRAFGHRLSSHLFQTQCLCGHLQIVVLFDTLGAVLVFDRIGNTFTIEFHHIAFADQSKLLGSHRQRPLDTHAFAHFHAGLIDALMHRVATLGVDVVVESLLDVDQRILARTVAVMLQRGEHDGVGGLHP